uniref:ATP synthase subunit a n=3 Tax=Varroa destructor TaxID=109461 RepID=Q8HEI4_VARDE|nr:ATP synthase 6 [Varroa destructor]
MLNLFSIFDPSTSLYFSMNWLSMGLLYRIYFPCFWKMKSRVMYLYYITAKMLYEEIVVNFLKMNKMLVILFITMFFYLMGMNYLGLLPYVFTPTSHMSVTMSLSLSVWMTIMIFGWSNFFNKMMKHLVPEGTPIYLASFMVLIESISNLIRPLTLAVRLVANMIAGHLLLVLLSSLGEMSMMYYMFTLPLMISLTVLEMFVTIIQSYVYMILLVLYLNEV